MPLSQTQMQVICALATGSTITEAAKSANVSRPTVYNWIKSDEEFNKALAWAKKEWAQTIQDRMQSLARKALDTIEAILDDPKAAPGVKLRAALAILNRPRTEEKAWTLPADLQILQPKINASAPLNWTKFYTSANVQPPQPAAKGASQQQAAG